MAIGTVRACRRQPTADSRQPTADSRQPTVELRELLTTLTLQPGQRLILDLATMEFRGSSGLTALIAARNHAHVAWADIALAAVPPRTLRVLRVVGLDQIFPLHPDSHSATRS
ncbi:STAS domain-containing protein [Streptomyces hirsutus]|uniref:STAS domain-containing protein n=1 Tax=Streptomyces hirsutus TaxID=35620 RepID=UPI0038662F2D|nr:STAS domain-containing protein [Streptomyces hirsutus]